MRAEILVGSEMGAAPKGAEDAGKQQLGTRKGMAALLAGKVKFPSNQDSQQRCPSRQERSMQTWNGFRVRVQEPGD